jgi:hypothetical protein
VEPAFWRRFDDEVHSARMFGVGLIPKPARARVNQYRDLTLEETNYLGSL